MRLLRQVLTGVAVLAIALMIVDCSENLHEAFDEQVSRLVAEQPSAAIADGSKVEYAGETQSSGPKCRAEGKAPVTELPKETTEASQEPDTSNKEAKDKKGVEAKATKTEQESDKQAQKPNKYKVYTITIPDDPSAEVLVEKSSASKKPAEKHDEPESSSDPVPVDSRANTKDVVNQKMADDTQAERQTEEASRKEEKLAKDQLNSKNSKADKKMKGKSTKRDKRETKKSGSSKNGKTKRSAEKSKKYESKKKSKK